jgi:hypothetical protein
LRAQPPHTFLGGRPPAAPPVSEAGLRRADAPDAVLLKPLDAGHRDRVLSKRVPDAGSETAQKKTKLRWTQIHRSFDAPATGAVSTDNFFFEEPSEELPEEPLEDPPREEDEPLSASSLSKRPFSSLSRSLLDDPPRLLLLSRPEVCRLSLSRSPLLFFSSGTRTSLKYGRDPIVPREFAATFVPRTARES